MRQRPRWGKGAWSDYRPAAYAGITGDGIGQVSQVAAIIAERDDLCQHLAAIRAAAADCKPAVHVRQGWVEVPESVWRELMAAVEGEGSKG